MQDQPPPASMIDHIFLAYRFVGYRGEHQLEEGHEDYDYICRERESDQRRVQQLKEYIMTSYLERIRRYWVDPEDKGQIEKRESKEIAARLDSVFKRFEFGWERHYPGDENSEVC